ncbi:MAG: hypothetical protein ACI8PZ_003841 [Myxococcota bacterium]|jgi:hypothetical protein
MITRLLTLLALVAAPLVASAQDPERVTLTLGEFLKLYEQGKNRPDKPDQAPRDHVLSSAKYVGEVVLDDGEPVSAVFEGTFRIENLGKTDWIRVGLLPSSVAVQEARIAGRPAPLLLEGGRYILTTDQKGAFDVTVRFAVGVNSSRGSSGFAFTMEAAGATSVELAVPTGESLDFTVANARLKSDDLVGGKRVVRATLPSQGSLSVAWQRAVQESSTQEAQQARVYAEVHTLVGIGEGVLRAQVTLNQTILFAGLDTLRVKVPTDMTLLDVSGAGLRDWTLADDGTLTVLLNYEAEGAYQLSLDLEKVVAGAVEVPLVQPLGVERSKGFVGVQALGNLELGAGAVQAAASVDVRTLPASILGRTATPVLLGFKYLGDGAVIPLDVSEHEEVDVLVTLLDQAAATTMFTADGRRLTSVRYQVRNNRKQFLRLALPEEAELWSASVAGKAVQPAAGGDGRLLVPLVRSSAQGGSLSAFEVEVVYVENGEAPSESGKGRFEAELPRADAPTTYVGWTIYAPWDARVKKKRDGSLRAVDYLSSPMAATEVFELEADIPMQQKAAAGQVAHGGLGGGAQPVEVSLPLDGQMFAFEKLLALDERLWVGFDYSGLR